MASLTVIIHERRGAWARQLRPRLAPRPIRWRETRSTADLDAALAGAARPLVVIDLADRPREHLRDLARVCPDAPDALILVLDPAEGHGTAAIARELGATLVLTGVAIPPAVAALLARWLDLTLGRIDTEGWATHDDDHHDRPD